MPVSLPNTQVNVSDEVPEGPDNLLRIATMIFLQSLVICPFLNLILLIPGHDPVKEKIGKLHDHFLGTAIHAFQLFILHHLHHVF